ncbi:hypothetical protein OSTOST_14113, partial [Ostertagia ostertagi]
AGEVARDGVAVGAVADRDAGDVGTAGRAGERVQARRRVGRADAPQAQRAAVAGLLEEGQGHVVATAVLLQHARALHRAAAGHTDGGDADVQIARIGVGRGAVHAPGAHEPGSRRGLHFQAVAEQGPARGALHGDLFHAEAALQALAVLVNEVHAADRVAATEAAAAQRAGQQLAAVQHLAVAEHAVESQADHLGRLRGPGEGGRVGVDAGTHTGIHQRGQAALCALAGGVVGGREHELGEHRVQRGEVQAGGCRVEREGALRRAAFEIGRARAQARGQRHEGLAVGAQGHADGVEHAVVAGVRAGRERAGEQIEVARETGIGERRSEGCAKLGLGAGDAGVGHDREAAGHQCLGRLAAGQHGDGAAHRREVQRAAVVRQAPDAHRLVRERAAGFDAEGARARQRDRPVGAGRGGDGLGTGDRLAGRGLPPGGPHAADRTRPGAGVGPVPGDHGNRRHHAARGGGALHPADAVARCPDRAGRLRRRLVLVQLPEGAAGGPAEDRRPVRAGLDDRSTGPGRPGAAGRGRGAGLPASPAPAPVRGADLGAGADLDLLNRLQCGGGGGGLARCGRRGRHQGARRVSRRQFPPVRHGQHGHMQAPGELVLPLDQCLAGATEGAAQLNIQRARVVDEVHHRAATDQADRHEHRERMGLPALAGRGDGVAARRLGELHGPVPRMRCGIQCVQTAFGAVSAPADGR